ncbi:hypothetical protein cypCar_00028230, partial [Cyprinus carpio]
MSLGQDVTIQCFSVTDDEHAYLLSGPEVSTLSCSKFVRGPHKSHRAAITAPFSKIHTCRMLSICCAP